MSATRDPAYPAAPSAVRARPVAKLVDDREPLIRAELFGPDRLEQHAESLAVAQQVAKGRGTGGRWSARLRDNGRVLLAAYRTIVAAVHEQRAITPSAEWLVDNFHVVEQQIHEIREDLPPGYYRQLPKLASGPLAGAPRVFGIAWAFVAHTDSLVDPALLTRFVRAYQRVQPLTIGELWAVAITLRIVLVENLRRATEVIVDRRAARQDADRLADRILAEAGASADAPCRRMPRTMTKAFAVQLVQRLRDHDPAVTPGLRWLDESLAAQGTDSGAIVADELRQQGAMNVTVRNIVTSMRLLSAIDWSEFFESVSLVDAALRDGSDFAAMDFPTRDMYRHAIEELARGSGRTELEIVAAALVVPETLTDAATGTDTGTETGLDLDTEQRLHDAAIERERRRDPGYRLVGAGRIAFERSVGFRPSFGRRLARLQRSFGIAGYAGSVVGLCATVVVLLLIGLASANAGLPVLAVVGLLAILPASEVAVMLMNRRVTRVLGPAVLPALECKDGVPASLRSMVAVPVLLSSVDGVDESIDRLEVHFLASPDDDLCFALLSDWPDAPTEHAADDDAVLARAAAGIAELNRRYGRAPAGTRFLLLHRRRLWNPLEGRWIGWERKRGKLHELNRWLRGANDTTFLPIDGVMPVPPEGVRFVITLDADTRLPHGVARQLVGKLAHPLNRPGFDRRTGVVVRGHAVLQPRITPSLPSDGHGSRFQRVFAGPRGLDPYAFAASDVYQDLLGEGSYTGKGIYDVDAFEAALAGRVPENAVLSHDLLEGSFARAALVSDVELVEDFPSRYDVAASRQHRWARGDWQLLPWVLGLPGKHVPPHGYAIPRIGRWKLIDNLRRTMVPLASVLLLVFGWLIGGDASVVASAFVLATIVLPTLTPVFDGLAAQRRGLRFRVHVVSVRDDVSLAVQQAFFAVTFLAHQAWLTTDAVVRTLFRMFVRRGRMLEWVTAAQAQSREPLDLAGHYRRMLGAVAAAAGFGVAVAVVTPESLRHALPFLVLWCAAPVVAWWASRSTTPTGAASLQPADQRLLRGIARRTFGYFETFVGPDDNYLPPDNVQEDPRSVVATRTSPTNIGMYLLSVVSARDFGWIGTHDLAERLEATFATIRRLETFHGHLYNWYETRTLRPLDPRYVSSVDSGNLAGHLIAVGNACRAATAELLSTRALRDGVEDQLELIRAATERVRGAQGTDAVTPAHLGDAIAAFAATLAALPAEPSALAPWFDEASTRAETVVDVATTLVAGRRDDASIEVFTAAHSLVECLRSHERDFVKLIAAADTGAERALVERLIALDAIAKELVAAMRFDFLFDTKRKQLAIGYQVVEGRLDPSCYDLLASEARLASFVAIAKGDLPVEHWFHLGRTMAPVRGGAALLSWSGSLFEYLMPNLVLRTPEGSLLHQTCRLVVERQIRYGAQRGVPWGVSESGYNVRDIELTYQYSSFGIPGLGLKRGLGADVVVAPYATALAVMVDPVAAVANFRRLAEAGAVGRYGYYEALDYTSSRLVPGARVAIVRSFMAHHQGMTIVAIGNALHGGVMLDRFHAEPTVQATELLLQERIPRGVTIAKPRAEAAKVLPVTTEPSESSLRRFHTPHDRIPRTHLLANGRYAVMFTAAGSGYSRHRDLAITRWREDVTSDGHGSYVYLRDAGSGRIWSAGFQPSGAEPDQYEVSFSEGRAEIVRRDGSIVTTTEVAVSAEEDAEVRRISIANLGTRTREIEVTSYAEIVLTTPAADAAHPAFAKLFVQTEYVPSIATLVATRRRRSPDEPEIFVAHLAVVEGEAVGGWQYETDRARFIGRGRELRSPASIADGHPLSGTVGTVLDAVFSLRRRVRIPAGATAHVAFWTMVAPTREAVLDLADRHRDPAAFERVATLAWTHAQVQLQHLGVPPAEAHLFQRLANRILYSDPGLPPARGGAAGRRRPAGAVADGDLG